MSLPLDVVGYDPMPAHPCMVCGCGRFWLSLCGTWSCSVCEPGPAGREEWELVFELAGDELHHNGAERCTMVHEPSFAIAPNSADRIGAVTPCDFVASRPDSRTDSRIVGAGIPPGVS